MAPFQECPSNVGRERGDFLASLFAEGQRNTDHVISKVPWLTPRSCGKNRG
jgi:hypothetical protein